MSRLPRPCVDCGAETRPGKSRCDRHEKARELSRGTRQSRGYDKAHDALRKSWAPGVAAGRVDCARCGRLIAPGEAWDLGHADDRQGWTGPEHARCNRSAAGSKNSRRT